MDISSVVPTNLVQVIFEGNEAKDVVDNIGIFLCLQIAQNREPLCKSIASRWPEDGIKRIFSSVCWQGRDAMHSNSNNFLWAFNAEKLWDCQGNNLILQEAHACAYKTMHHVQNQ